jgi:hypothetical protein
VTTRAEIDKRNHGRAVRFFWCLLIGATTVSLIGNIAHVVLPYLPRVAVQIGAAVVPPLVLLAAVHGIALAVRAGASGWVYRCAVGAVAIIGVGAFAVSFLALRDLMRAIGYSAETAWIFPATIDTAVAVSTVMLVALEDKPVRRIHTTTLRPGAEVRGQNLGGNRAAESAKPQVKSHMESSAQAQHMQKATQETAQADGQLAAQLIASRVTTQPVETVVAVLSAQRRGASINAAAKAVGVNYRTAKRIVEAATDHKLGTLLAAS